MKSILLTLFTFLFLSGVIGQNQTDSIAKVSSETINTDITQYTFVSNYYISEYKAPMLEGRLLNRYSEIIEIHINAETQTVKIKTPSSGSSIFLDKFIIHFKYSGYEIH